MARSPCPHMTASGRDAPGTGQRPNATAAPPGFTAIGLDDIATEAGVTRVLLYRHFDSKADVY